MEQKVDCIDMLQMDIRGNTSDLLADKIRNLILCGDLPEGYIFPNETRLCEKIGVGRSTLREAYKALECTGFIRRVKRAGTVVNGFYEISKDSPLRTSLVMSDFKELMEFRIMIEGELARLAALRATQENLDNLHFSLEQMKKNQYNIEELTIHDVNFHMEIANSSRNRILISTMENIKELFKDGIYKAFQVDTENNVQEAISLHTSILEAIENKDSEKAYTLMRNHIASICGRMDIS